MAGLLFLESRDFYIKESVKGEDVLCNNIAGYSFILFYSNQCVHCQSFIPLFKRLPGTVSGCYFGMLNVNVNRTLVDMSKQTITPIKHVPYMIVYVNGRPFVQYNGPRDAHVIRDFIKDISNKLHIREKFAVAQRKTGGPQPSVPPLQIKNVHNNKQSRIPEFSIGTPKSDDEEVYYLEFDDAYKKDVKSK